MAACSSDGWMTVNCRCCSLEWACYLDELVFLSTRFGQWTATYPFTWQRSMATVGVWLGVQTGNQRTTRVWTRPGNRPTISFWLGELINGRGFVRNGIELAYKKSERPHFHFSPKVNPSVVVFLPCKKNESCRGA